MPASVLEREVLPARVDDYQPAMLDTLMAAGEVVWVGVEPLGERDGRIALYLTDHLRARSGRTGRRRSRTLEGRAAEILAYLREHGASFFARDPRGHRRRVPDGDGRRAVGAGVEGLVTNDTLHPLRAYARTEDTRSARRHARRAVPLAAARAAARRRTMVAACGRRPRATEVVGNRMGGRDGAAAARAPRRRHARDGRGRSGRRRLHRGLPGAEGDGGRRTHPPRLLRRRPRRRAVRDARRARSAALDARRARDAADGRAGRDRSRESVRRHREVARRVDQRRATRAIGRVAGRGPTRSRRARS